MNSLQSELYREINSYLAPKDRLVFSTSTIYSTSFCYEKELRKYILKRHESAKLLIPFIIIGNKNPLFGMEEDFTEFIDEISHPGSLIEKQKCMFEHISYFTDRVLEKFHYISFHKLNFSKQKSLTYMKKKGVYSPKIWGSSEDKSILIEDSPVSVLYGVKVPSRQYFRIKYSKVLKSIIG
uniref:Uncharacterized protein n=1 Tax=viral metagenome TaxID=1070528 RepID=A0A6C0KLT4_9ZZZZ